MGFKAQWNKIVCSLGSVIEVFVILFSASFLQWVARFAEGVVEIARRAGVDNCDVRFQRLGVKVEDDIWLLSLLGLFDCETLVL